MDHPPREMKEAIFTRLNQTVLPLLANTKKDTLQSIYISFVNTSIDNKRDNRVLSNRPLPINDEEPHFSIRQRATLSQLRSGHYKLLNSYKKRLMQTDSSIFPDCGIDPHDVPHTSIALLTAMICRLWRRHGNWAFWNRVTWIHRLGWLKRPYNNTIQC